MLMRVSVGIHKEDIAAAIETYPQTPNTEPHTLNPKHRTPNTAP